uniref:Uncharacterized protein n=1 Tax=Romanomermis culicivorax TaxID=13658 RepID=A0A915J9Y1_ROMCU
MPPTTAATHITRTPFILMAMMILATPMDTIMRDTAMITATAGTTTINPAQHPITIIIPATNQQLLY